MDRPLVRALLIAAAAFVGVLCGLLSALLMRI